MLGCVVTVLLAGVATYILIKLIDRCVGVNISIETELHGLDIMEIGEVAYGLDDDDDDEEKLSMKLCEFAAAGDLLEIKRFYRLHHSLDFKDYDERGALHVAAAGGHLEVCKFLVKKGLSVNGEDKYGRKPIVDALLKGQRAAITFLQKEGTEIDCAKYIDKWFMAIVSKDLHNIQCFISFGISADAQDYDKRTALHLAVSYKMPKVIKLLVSVGAKYDLKDRWGKSPVDYA